MFEPRVEHMANLLAWMTQERMTVQRALEMPVYHSVVEEGLRTALRDLAARLSHLCQRSRSDRDGWSSGLFPRGQ
jgi:dihydrolipoamide dehydrogenase